MGRWRPIITIAVALVIAFVVSIFLYKWLQKQITPEKAEKPGAVIVSIAVAAVDLPWGTKVGKEQIKSEPFLEGSLPPGHFKDLSLLEGRVLTASLKQGEPVLESRLAPVSVTTGGISAVVTPGKRALAVKGSKVIGLSGLIRPGNRVDVIVTMTNPTTDEVISKTVLENVLVLATGTEMEVGGKGTDKESPVDVYTLEVAPEEGEKLSLADSQGKLSFALRSATDMETVLTTGATITETLASFSGAKPKKTGEIRRIKPAAAWAVQTIRGTEASELSY